MVKYNKILILLGCLLTSLFAFSKSRNIVNVSDFGIYPIGIKETESDKFNRWHKIQKLFMYCISNDCDMFFPKGVYDVGIRNFPFRSPEGSQSLLDCRNISVFGEGLETVFMTTSVRGADVIQLNMVKNINIRDLKITAVQTGFNFSGSNGISITNGWDNIVLDNIICFDLPGVNKGTWVDGGKGLTIQFGSNITLQKGSVKATRIKSINNAYGFRFDGRYVDEILRWNPRIQVQIEVERAFQGISISFGNSSKNIQPDSQMNFFVEGNLKNCQQSVVMARVMGGVYNLEVNNTMGTKLLNYSNDGKNWVSDNDETFVLLCQAPQNIYMKLSGVVTEVDKLIWLGAIGRIIEPHNFENKSKNNVFSFDLSGKATTILDLIESTDYQSVEDSQFWLNSDLEASFHRLLMNKKGVEFFRNNYL